MITVVAVPLDGIQELIVRPHLAPPTRTCQDDRLRVAKGFGACPKQRAGDHHRIEHLDSALSRQCCTAAIPPSPVNSGRHSLTSASSLDVLSGCSPLIAIPSSQGAQPFPR
ncbi:hypothetical protein ACFC18_30830 [Streptomyces sp. NPDC056121]|uniref:hypothetical protein n=1 Tax=unclassified Streptomyces TaxID=2593676 RepID=UPI0035D5C168